MKKITLIYIAYVVSILSITMFLSTILKEKIRALPTGFFSDVNETEVKNLGETDIINSLKRFQEMEEKNPNIARNSLGFKDYEWQIEKPQNVYRIIALGDSMTEGAFVSTNETWPKQLEKKLNELTLLYKFEVFNMGGCEFDIGAPEELEAFKNIGLKYNPNMIILQYYNNDWRSPEMKAKAKKLWKDYKEGIYKLPSNIEKEVRRLNASESAISRLIYEIILRDYYATTSLEDEWDKWVKPYISELIEICRNKSIKLVVITWDKNNIQESKLISILRKSNTPYYDLSNYLPNFPYPSSTRLPDGHLTPLGYEIVANKTLEILIKEGMIK
jgi:lysophospholipase L1-like esterase